MVLDHVPGGIAFIPASTPLIRLNYYDGKFLRASDMTLEAQGHRRHVELSNRAGGPGVVHGFDLELVGGGRLQVSEGLALDPQGRVLYLPDAVTAEISDLIQALHGVTAASPSGGSDGPPAFAPCEPATAVPTVPVTVGSDLYLVAIGHAEGLCGNEEVFGRLCDDACVTAADRPYRLDGVLVVAPTAPAPTAPDLVAGPDRPPTSDRGSPPPSSPTSGRPEAACCPPPGSGRWSGATARPSSVARSCRSASSTSRARRGWTRGSPGRERMVAPPQSYWAGRMELRPWPVFLAQVLQFQCQLREALGGGTTPTGPFGGGGSPGCEDLRVLLGRSTDLLQEYGRQLDDLDRVAKFRKQVDDVLTATPVGTSEHVLIDRGIVELPSAGYLPVDPDESPRPLRAQVRELLGDGVDLRFCAVRRDQIAHELERAQHMERISLLAGLDDPEAVQDVDILVPDGEAVEDTLPPTEGRTFAIGLAVGPSSGHRYSVEREHSGSVAPPPAEVRAEGPPAPAEEDPFVEVSEASEIPWMTDEEREIRDRLVRNEDVSGFLGEADADLDMFPLEGVARMILPGGLDVSLAALGGRRGRAGAPAPRRLRSPDRGRGGLRAPLHAPPPWFRPGRHRRRGGRRGGDPHRDRPLPGRAPEPDRDLPFGRGDAPVHGRVGDVPHHPDALEPHVGAALHGDG